MSEKPSVARMAETIEKLQEDLDGHARPKGWRRACALFGEPIDLSQAAGRPRAAAEQVTDRLEAAIIELMKAEA